LSSVFNSTGLAVDIVNENVLHKEQLRLSQRDENPCCIIIIIIIIIIRITNPRTS